MKVEKLTTNEDIYVEKKKKLKWIVMQIQLSQAQTHCCIDTQIGYVRFHPTMMITNQ